MRTWLPAPSQRLGGTRPIFVARPWEEKWKGYFLEPCGLGKAIAQNGAGG